MRRLVLLISFALLFLYGLTAQREGVEAFEVGQDRIAELPKGKEADGIVGDFVLRNGKIELLVGGNLPLRRANMMTEWHTPIPGTIFDLDLRGTENDQLTAFRPGDEKGALSWVRVVESSAPGSAAIEAVRTAAKGGGLYTRHEYRLQEDQQHVVVTSTYRNEGGEPRKITPRAVFKRESEAKQAGEVRVLNAVDPFDKRGYAWAPVEPPTIPEEVELAPGDEKTYEMALAVAGSPLAAYGLIAGVLGETGEVSGRITDADGEPAVRAALVAEVEGVELEAYPDSEGRYSLRLPVGGLELGLRDIGREEMTKTATAEAGGGATLDWQVAAVSKVVGVIRDEQGRPSPAKIQFLGRNGTPDPDVGTPYRVHGASHQYQTHDGRFEQQTPPGEYLLRITHGPEYDLTEREIVVAPGKTVQVEAVVRRTVRTPGWVSTDFHAHSTPSGDNYCRTDDRIINFAAEHIEFAPTTEHNRIYDWEPHIDRLGLSGRLKTVPGIELTGRGQHFNSFPLTPDPTAQNGGAPVWHYDPRINAMLLRNWATPTRFGDTVFDAKALGDVEQARFGGGPDRWVQANHPQVQSVFFDRNDDGVRDGGFVGFEKLIDAAEVWSAEILNQQPTYQRPGEDRSRPNRTFFWLQMLNQGRHVWCVAVSDAHRIFGNGVGDWRTYVPSSTDEPRDIDHKEIIRNAKAGRMMITNGPFLEVKTADGMPIGSSIHGEGSVALRIRVQAPNWVEVDRVQVLVNGRPDPRYDYRASSEAGMFQDGVVRFDKTVSVALQEDSHLIVVATDEDSDLSLGWGLNPQGKMRPVAFTNPIYVDVGHDGFQANGDTLGHPLPAALSSTD